MNVTVACCVPYIDTPVKGELERARCRSAANTVFHSGRVSSTAR